MAGDFSRHSGHVGRGRARISWRKRFSSEASEPGPQGATKIEELKVAHGRQSRSPWSDRPRRSRGEQAFYGAFVGCITLTVMSAFAVVIVQPIAVAVLTRINVPV